MYLCYTKITARLHLDINSWLIPIKYNMTKLMLKWMEWIDTGNKGSSEFTKRMLLKVQFIFMMYKYVCHGCQLQDCNVVLERAKFYE